MFAEDRSKTSIVQSSLDVKSWLAKVPSVDAVRPGRCPCCDAASRPAGEALGLCGHGLRDRQQRGPLWPGAPAETVVVRVRRYRCRSGGCVITVVPCGVIPHLQFSGPAIGLAVALFGAGVPATEVRRRVSPWATLGPTAAAGWASLGRWLRSIGEGRLFPRLRRWGHGTPRRMAEWVGAALAAFAPPAFASRAPHEQAFFGVAQMG